MTTTPDTGTRLLPPERIEDIRDLYASQYAPEGRAASHVRELLAHIAALEPYLAAAERRAEVAERALESGEFALNLALGATYDDRSWLDEAMEALNTVREARAAISASETPEETSGG